MAQNSERPPAVLFAASHQVLWGCIWLYRAVEFDSLLFRVLLLGIAGSHFAAAVGLYLLVETGRQRAVQLCVFDVGSAVLGLLSGHLSALGAVFQLGMPLYTLSVLKDRDIRGRFS